MNPLNIIGPALTAYEIYDITKPLLTKGAKYIHDSMSTPLRTPANNVASTTTKLKNLGSRKKPAPTTATDQKTLSKKKDHSDLAQGLVVGAAAAIGSIGTLTNNSVTQLKTNSDSTKAANDALLASLAGSPLLKNQIEVKQSIDYLIDAINAQSVVIFQGLNPLSVYMQSLVVGVQALTDAVLGLDPSVILPELAPVINVPDSPAPIVNVSAPAPTVNVSAPAPDVVVNVPTSPAPTVNVSAPAPDVVVNVPTSPAPTVNVEAPIIPDYSSQFDRMADSADAVKEHHEFLKTPVAPVDTATGTGTLELSPRDAHHAKNAEHARGEADTNSIGGGLLDELSDIFDGDAANLLKIFSYFPVTASTSALGTTDDFESKLNAWRSAQ